MRSFTLFFILIFMMLGCKEESNHAVFDLAPNYVSFSNPSEITAEEGKSYKVSVRPSINIDSDITYYLALAGTAGLDKDFKISVKEGSTTESISSLDQSSLVLVGKKEVTSFEVSFLDDGEADGEKTLTFTLEKAVVSKTSEELTIGKLDTQKSINFIIKDIN